MHQQRERQRGDSLSIAPAWQWCEHAFIRRRKRLSVNNLVRWGNQREAKPQSSSPCNFDESRTLPIRSQTALVPIFAVIKFTHLRICRCEHADNELISNRDGGCALDDHTASYSRGNSRRDYRPGAAIKT